MKNILITYFKENLFLEHYMEEFRTMKNYLEVVEREKNILLFSKYCGI